MTVDASVAIPVRDGAATLDGVLRAVRAQRFDGAVELLVCDSGSRDGSLEIARRHGARVIEIAPEAFSHGATRNLLVAESGAAHVAFLTQDAEPADERWLARLVEGFSLADDVALVYGPYRPRPGADVQTARELERWFRSLAPDGRPRVDRLDAHERLLDARELFGRRTFFTDANACLSRAVWERVPFPPVAYAEDHALALQVLRAGYAKVFVPDAAVWHSHDYTPLAQFRRAFDEWRGLLEVYGWREPAAPGAIARRLRGELGARRRELARAGVPRRARARALLATSRHHVIRLAGAVLGSRADRLRPRVRGWLSLEGRRSIGGIVADPRAPNGASVAGRAAAHVAAAPDPSPSPSQGEPPLT